MGIRTQLGKGVEAALGADRTNRVRALERSVRGRVATQISPAEPETGSRAVSPNPLEAFFRNNDGRLIHKWHHYFDIYHRHFAQFRDRPITLVEFGVFHGGSLQMWKDYFGPQVRIIGVDINPNCARLAEPQIEIMIGDQEDPEFLAQVAEAAGRIDVLIEDGGHSMGQQLATFKALWPSIKRGGVFLIEDLHTSYWESYGGGHLREGTFIEFAKTLIDDQHAWHSKEPSLSVGPYTKTITGMHVYDSVIVFDKGRRRPPTEEKTGTPSI